jgi:hypothetical protein
MKRPLACVVLSLCVAGSTGSLEAQDPDKKEWVALFNGKDLSGWVPKFTGFAAGVNYNGTYRVENGVLRVVYDKWDAFDGHFGHLFYKTPYSHYVLAVEYRFLGDQVKGGPDWGFRNSGAMLHGQLVETMGKDQDFPISIEGQLLGGRGDGKPRSTANLCTPGTNVHFGDSLVTRHCINSTSKTYDGDQWVRVEALSLGDSIIKHIANGDTVLVYRKPEMGGGNANNTNPGVLVPGQPIVGGSISLQAETAEIDFRKVEVLNLEGCMDPKSKSYRPYFIKHDPAACK